MQFNCKNNSSKTSPSDIVKSLLEFEELEAGSFFEWLQKYDFNSEEEIKNAIKRFAFLVCEDDFICNKYAQENNIHVKCMYKRFYDLLTKEDKLDKFAKDYATRLWNSFYVKRKKTSILKALRMCRKNSDTFISAKNKIAEIYDLQKTDIEKIHFFVEQCKAGDDFPNSLRRMLYFWSEKKKTGKTTTANIIVAILNGHKDISYAHEYQTTLTNEMQIGGFKVPRISKYNACVMDECFYSDMGKTYTDFKRFLTSSNGHARIPYGQEFEWLGVPNYIATSNDSLTRFIKDWNDRRYLSINFKNEPKEKKTIDELFSLWYDFISNSQIPEDMTWSNWGDRIAKISDEKGEREERANEYAEELQQNTFLNTLTTRQYNPASLTCAQNRITLKFFVDYFSIGNNEARKQRSEIEKAVLEVFGERYSSTNYWLLSDLRTKAFELKDKNNQTEQVPF